MSTGVRRVGVAVKGSSGHAVRLGRELLTELGRRGLEAVVDSESAEALGAAPGPERHELTGRVDLVVVLGGDGTLLSVVRGDVGATPILGFNLGTLGFLTEHPADRMTEVLDEALAGELEVEMRERLVVEVHRPGREPFSDSVFNDAVVTKSALARIIAIEIRVNDEFVSRVRADGLIVASPSGSTAYNLSAGGPIVHPALQGMLITPICPHTLTNRPLAVSLDSIVDLRLEGDPEEVYLTLDGQEGFPITPADLVRIRRCPQPVALLKRGDRSFFQILHHKLKWGDREG